MRLTFLWPGRTKNPELRALQELFAARIQALTPCRVVETRTARGMDEKLAGKIKEIEAQGLERHLAGAYVVCLGDQGQEMTSQGFARFLRDRERDSGREPAFVVGGFLGLADRLVAKADLVLSLSRLTFSHELCRVVLLEQVYRALATNRGRRYAK